MHLTLRPWSPGPWSVCQYPAPNPEWHPNFTIGSSEDTRVCDLTRPAPPSRTRANGFLIAAAPHLYEALEALMASDNEDQAAFNHAYRNAEKALRLAQGQTEPKLMAVG